MAAIDIRRFSLRFGEWVNGSLSQVSEYDESFFITAKVRKTVLEIQNTCEISIHNLTPEKRQFLLGQFNLWRARNQTNPFVPLDIRIGRQSQIDDDLITVFTGAVHTSSLGVPPDLPINIVAMTSLTDKNVESTGFITQTAPVTQSHKQICQWAANLMQLTLRYDDTLNLPTITDRMHAQILNRAYSLTGLIGFIANLHKSEVCVFVDDGELVVTKWSNALRKPPVDISAENGLIGIPGITEWGVKFTTLADVRIRLAGQVNLLSTINPDVNQAWIITGVEYDLSTRDNQWYATWTGSPSAV